MIRFRLVMMMLCFAVLQLNAQNNNATATKEATLTEVTGLLKELIAKVEQPVMVNIGGRVVDEMEKQTSLRKTYNTKMDSGYGTFG